MIKHFVIFTFEKDFFKEEHYKEYCEAFDKIKNAFDGNFPGIRMENVFQEKPKGNNSYKTIKEVAENAINNKIKFIASVSSIPALRNAKEHKNIEFIQGIEKLIESVHV